MEHYKDYKFTDYIRGTEPQSFSIGDELSFINRFGRESKVKILSIDKIGEGAFGSIFQSDVEMSYKNSKKRVSFVIKEFGISKDAEMAFRHYNLLAGKGIKIFNTYRLNKERTVILMTNGNTEERFLVSSNLRSDTAKFLKENRIETITGFDDFLLAYFDHAKLAAKKRVWLAEDSYFFSISSSRNYKLADSGASAKISFLVGDLDIITEYPKLTDDELIAHNLREAHYALFVVLENILLEELQAPYFRQMHEYLHEYLMEEIKSLQICD